MTRREKIILAATGVVALIGLWVGLGGKSTVPPPAPDMSGEVAKAGSMLAAIKASALSPAELALISAIDAPWREKAFYDKPFPGQEGGKPTSLPRYSGYVELGSGRLAVVDGMEYQVGDTLESGGYKVVSITSDQVVLESLVNGKRIEIPYEGREAANP